MQLSSCINSGKIESSIYLGKHAIVKMLYLGWKEG